MGMRLGLATHAMIDLVSFPDQTMVVVTPTQRTAEEEIRIQNVRLESLQVQPHSQTLIFLGGRGGGNLNCF